MESEILSEQELEEITGYKERAWQRRWLDKRQWHYVQSRGGRPLVGRLYARQMLGTPAVQPSAPTQSKPTWTPDFSKVN